MANEKLVGTIGNDQVPSNKAVSTTLDHGHVPVEVAVIPMLKRHEIQVLLKAGHSQRETAELAQVALSTVKRVLCEPEVQDIDTGAERRRRGIGRPSKAEPFRHFVRELLKEEPTLMSLEVLRRAREKGYTWGKSAFYELVAAERPHELTVMMRFEGLPGEFSQHDFGQVEVRFMDGSIRKVHFFASRLKWSRWASVSLVENEKVETLIWTLAEHFTLFGGVPLCAVFDRPKTVAISWGKDGQIREWNPTFAYAALELGFTAEVCWPYQPRQKGCVENLVGWVKGSFFKQRRFHDMEDLREQLSQWQRETNYERPSRATSEIPEVRRQQELARLRPMRIPAEELSIRIPVQVGPTAEVFHDGRGYSMPPEAAGLSGTLYLFKDRVRIVAGPWEATHPRDIAKGKVSRLAEHRAALLAAVSGKRGKRYLKRQQLFETGTAAVEFLTELVHQKPRSWFFEVERLHQMLQQVGAEKMDRAFRSAVQTATFSVDFIAQALGVRLPPDGGQLLFPGVAV
jgi:transposase